MTDVGSIWESKRRKLQDLDDQLDQQREANRENRRIIATLTSRIPAIEAPSETPGLAETGEEQQDRGPTTPVRCPRGSGGRPGVLTAALLVTQGVSGVSPDTIAVGVFTIVGTIAGALVGLFGERIVRRLGYVRSVVKEGGWQMPEGAYPPGGGDTPRERRLRILFLNHKDVPVTVWDMHVKFYSGGKPLPAWTRPHVQLVAESGVV